MLSYKEPRVSFAVARLSLLGCCKVVKAGWRGERGGRDGGVGGKGVGGMEREGRGVG